MLTRENLMPRCFCLLMGLLVIGVSYGSQAQDKPAGKIAKIKIKSTYKTLGFKGIVERIDQGDSYEFLIQLELRYIASQSDSGAYTMDLTQFENIRTCELKAFQKPEMNADEPAGFSSAAPQPKELFKDSYSLSNILVKKGEEPLLLPDIKLHMPKSVYSGADYVRILIGDGYRLWPIAAELKTK
jgi:hypothetical protein